MRAGGLVLLGVFADELGVMLSPHVAEDEKVVQKGLMLYRQGMVSGIRFERDQQVLAAVQDVIQVKVALDLEFPGLSECSCPAEGFCRHMLAVFFAAYAREASVSDWVEVWRTPLREVNQASVWGLKQAKDLVKANGMMKPDYGHWVHSMTVSFDSILRSKKHANPYVVAELFQIYERRLKAGIPLDPKWRQLYELISNVFSFQKLAQLSEEMGHTEEMIKRSYLHILHQMMDDAEESAMRIYTRSIPFDFEPFMEKFTEDSLGILTCCSGFEYERIYLYRILWAELFKKKDWREAEIERIAARLKRLEDWQSPFPLMIAGIHLHLLLENDEKALELVEAVEEDSIVPYLPYWIDLLSEQKAWQRAGSWIEVLIMKLRKYLASGDSSYYASSGFTRLALKSISPYCLEKGRSDLYERALMQTLPYSFYDYEYLLFERGQYQRWGELYSFVGIPYSDLPKDRLKIVEKEQPDVLFSLLHQTIQHEIELKNRPSYKLAVRHMKKLRTLYKKMKRTDDWEFFLEALLEKTKRLRAFQEECKRSKLIDA